VEKVQQTRPVQSEAGQATVEFALTITMTLLLIFGMIDFSRAVYTVSVIQWAAQKGARTGIVESSTEEIEAAVRERMIALDADQAQIVVSHPSVNMVRVDVTYEFELLVPFIAQITGDSIPLSGSASMIAY
jgi:Flp pilus assembly protein TadG